MSTTTVTYTLTESEMRKPPNPKGPLPSLFDEPVTTKNWTQFINWPQSLLLILTPVIALYGIFTTEFNAKTFVWAVMYYFMTTMGITAGYHRYWSHRAYSATLPLQLYLAAVGAGAVQGSIRWWSRGHRAHHRWTDTDKDPYSAHRGLFFSHIGWMLVKRPNSRLGYADIDDLKADPIVMFQHNHYLLIAVFMAAVFPTLVAGLGWGDWRGGYFYAAVGRLVLVHHATFCVNSLAHYLGDKTYDDRHTPRDHFITALVTAGEGYHNFHHEFPQDYRNAIKFLQYDPTKWMIWLCSCVGLAYNLKTFPENEITKGHVYMEEQKINEVKRRLKWGRPIQELPALTFDDFKDAVTNHGEKWILIEGIIYDVKNFVKNHPGGEKYMKMGMGKDMTSAFNGGMYDHSNGARNLLSTMRVAVCRGGGEVESKKRNPEEPILG